MNTRYSELRIWLLSTPKPCLEAGDFVVYNRSLYCVKGLVSSGDGWDVHLQHPNGAYLVVQYQDRLFKRISASLEKVITDEQLLRCIE